VGIEYCWTSLVKTLGTARNCQIAIEVVKFGAVASAITYFNNGYSKFEFISVYLVILTRQKIYIY
jgi:hypothetical protein